MAKKTKKVIKKKTLSFTSKPRSTITIRKAALPPKPTTRKYA